MRFERFVVNICVVAALLSGCTESQPPIGAPGVLPENSVIAAHSARMRYKILYSFDGGTDGTNPFGGLTDVGGTLYGMTVAGGTYSSCSFDGYDGCGTVYSVTLDGTEKVLHNFGKGSDGRSPRDAGLIDVGGTLYGTTTAGGSYACYGSSYSSCGTVFSITPSGAEKVLYSFSGYPNDGAWPHAGLTDVKGTLYGTTDVGGPGECYYSGYACGTVFSITTAGTETVLHGFTASPDGAFPFAGLIDVKGRLYGTTASGGKHGFGTVFSITTGGVEKILHSFGAGSDGRTPYAGLIELQGKLYGTTSDGGANSCGSHVGCGTVFSITPDGTEKVLYSFGHDGDGAHPQTSLIQLKGKLYGTTLSGGVHSCGSNCSYGTVFSIAPNGTEKVLHSFGARGDGAWPHAALTKINDTLYGTTSIGGAHGYGTVFSLKP